MSASRSSEPVGRDKFANAPENAFKVARDAPVSTFSIDVDTASYSFVRASLNRNVLPPPASVRTEELINYFPYAYEAPASASEPFRANVAVFPNPWSEGRKLIRIGIKGYALQQANRPRANLVFLIDTSGSMDAPNRLPLVKQSLAMLLTQLQPDDRVAIVTYAGNAGTALEPTAASEKAKILATIERLEARGSTAGAEGIRQAYALAEQNFDANGVNRVILATDGDFNVGITSKDELKGFVERQREKGIFLSVLGFGVGNYNDALAQTLAQNGNGVAAYIDTINEARKVLVEEASSTLFPIGKDVKIQVEFNPATVAEYRLIGYETRLLNRDDFANDKVDAGDVGSGQTVTALYDIVPVGGPRVVDDLRYGAQTPASGCSSPAEYAFVKIRYKLPRSDQKRADQHAGRSRGPNTAASRTRRSMPALQPAWPRSAKFCVAESTPASSAMTTCCVSPRQHAATTLTATAPSSFNWCVRPRPRAQCSRCARDAIFDLGQRPIWHGQVNGGKVEPASDPPNAMRSHQGGTFVLVGDVIKGSPRQRIVLPHAPRRGSTPVRSRPYLLWAASRLMIATYRSV